MYCVVVVVRHVENYFGIFENLRNLQIQSVLEKGVFEIITRI